MHHFIKEEFHPISPKEGKDLKEYIDENLAKGLIRKSESQAGYPILFMPKKSDELQLCMDQKKRIPYFRIGAIFKAMKGACSPNLT